MRRLLLLPFFFLLLFFSASFAQKKSVVKKYPSLFWEITGKGLRKPSYLFGTMHVSSKMVFHLSDSFYYAMRNTDAVALELNPEIWQDEMFRLQNAQLNLARFSLGKMNDYLKESSFKLEKYEDDIKRALVEEPTVVNNLLYRSFQSTADFEENTYLDLYIYQTGRKLGKRPAGVENYIESERLMLEAYQDMAKDKSKRKLDTDLESFYDIQKKIQQAYRNGDLDLMDSLQNLTSTSSAFSEKFLYLRNEIQANSIDTILKEHSLFVGVGAAHLPGPRGVIELLRKKGYRLRPIFMQDRDASQKEEIDKLKVPVVFHNETTPDNLIQLQLPGKFYKREEAKGNESWQYADMNNGSYYMLTRVRTHATMLGHNEKVVFNKVDSMLYENIPGKIIKKTVISKNGYQGFDITNRTRRGDLQRYEILITPYEVLVFKMSGNDTYVDGKEAETFFSSINLKPSTGTKWSDYSPSQGGFVVKLPGVVNEGYDKSSTDGTPRWEYEAVDNSNGNAYMIWKKSVYNFNFLEEDTFDLSLIEESFKRSELVSKELSRKLFFNNKRPVLDARYLMKDGAYVDTRAYVKGPHYYLLVRRSKDKKAERNTFFKSFNFANYNYPPPERYADSALKMEVYTSVKPNVDTMLRTWMEKAGSEGAATEAVYSGWPKNKTGIFASDSTGESVLVTVQTFPKYYYSRDSARFWKEKLDEQAIESDMVFKRKEYFKLNDSVCGYKVVLTDTNSSRCIKMAYYLKGNNLYKFVTITDTSANQSDFLRTFYATAKPLEDKVTPSIFGNKIDLFFADYSSADSLLSRQASQAITSIYFGKDGVDKIINAIDDLKFGDKDYFDTKSKFITELGYILDSSSKERLVPVLKSLYEKNADTAYFQNPVLASLARLQTKKSYDLLKELLLQDPPIFDNSFEYERIFNQFSDTLKLAKTLFPDILQLASLEDYRPYINNLLKSLVDSGLVSAPDYDSYFSKLYFDAKIELKKQQNKDEKQLGIESNDDGDDDNNVGGVDYRGIYNNGASTAAASSLEDYAVLLFPFYTKYNSVPKYFEKLLASKDVNVQLVAAKVLVAHNRKVPDSLFSKIAATNQYRAQLLAMLEKLNRKDLFPAKYKQQEVVAKSLLLNDKSYKDFADIQLVAKRQMEVKGIKGNVYLFRYKIKKDDDWKMGISGLQPLNNKDVTSNSDFVKMTDKKIKLNEAEIDQFNEQVKKLVFSEHKSGRRFYERAGGWDFSDSDFED